MIPFSPPYIDGLVKQEINDVLNSGWITTGPKVKELEGLISLKYDVPACVGVSSWTTGITMLLKWWGIGPGDEVIIPAYTYAATALSILHSGAKPIIVDVQEDFTINPACVEKAITNKTKAIIPVDFAGLPCDYDALNELVKRDNIVKLFRPSSDRQVLLGRIVVIADAAHSIGGTYINKSVGTLADFTGLSFHAVKNITSAEGGVLCLNLPSPFDNASIYPLLRRFSLNGQTKDAFIKTQVGAWKYDIVEMGMKCNLPDLNAALALGQLKQYDKLLERRRDIHQSYNSQFAAFKWAELPIGKDKKRESSYHVYPLRIKGITESQRDQIIDEISRQEIVVNVHFIPLPALSLFKEMGYRIEEVPKSYELYSRGISLPIYPQLTDENVLRIVRAVSDAVNVVLA